MTKKTEAKLLDSASSLFWQQGHKATSLDQIAANANQSKGAFFHYFRNKNDVTKKVLAKYAHERLIGPMDQFFAAHDDVKDALLAWVQGNYKYYTEHDYQAGCLMGNLALELADRDDDIREDLSALFLEWENALVRHLREKAKEGQLVMEPRQFARIVIAAMQGITMTIKVHKDKNRAGREFMALSEMIERLIKD
ncbi:MAG: TetR/AcrR family transcriptional regulator [Alphaproteobacteria bacterium]|nr:TetR/AcrR family transcriptional regulator [Alphaproteobacteria bacterium]